MDIFCVNSYIEILKIIYENMRMLLPFSLINRLTMLFNVRIFPLLLLLMMATAVQAFDYNYTTNNGAVTITGYTGPGGSVIIPDAITELPVTSIGEMAFASQTNLISVTIPHSVTNIGGDAFRCCYKLTNFMLGSNVANIGIGAFEYCTNLLSINIPLGVSSIEPWVFSSCTSLTNIMIPESVTNIGLGSFNRCLKLASINIPDGVASIGNDAFNNCRCLTSVKIPNGVASIGDSVFYSCFGLTNVVIPDSVTNIGRQSFDTCFSLASITIPNSVTSIGDDAFVNCDSLTSIEIPNSVISLGVRAFSACDKLISFRIGNSVTNVGSYTLSGCAWLTNIVIGSSVTSIGDYAFDCYSLTEIYFTGNAPSRGINVFYNYHHPVAYYFPWTTGWEDGPWDCKVNPAYTQWLLNHSLATNRTEDATDYDNDGMMNWQEYIAHTDPKTNLDRLAITTMGSGTNSAQISWQAKSNITYQVKRSWTLATWSNAPSGGGLNQESQKTAVADQVLQYADPSSGVATNAFYQITVAP